MVAINLNDNATASYPSPGICMITLGVFWFFLGTYLDNSPRETITVTYALIFIMIYVLVPYWFISSGWKIITAYKDLK